MINCLFCEVKTCPNWGIDIWTYCQAFKEDEDGDDCQDDYQEEDGQ